MIYKNTQPSFSLTSSWTCKFHKDSDGTVKWYILDLPNESSANLTFPVSLPADAVIKRAWLTMGVGSPLSGSDYQRVNGENIPSSGEVDVTGVTALTTSFGANFTFRANGMIFTDTETHSGVLTITDPTLNVEYTADSEDEDDAPTVADRIGSAWGMPRLLDNNLNEIARLKARVALSLNLTPFSTARLKVSPGETEVPVRAFVELFTPNESAGIFRVREAETTRGHGSWQTLYLEDALTTLSDDIAIGVQAMSGTFRQVASTLLEAQTVKRWVIGDVELPDEYELVYEYSYDNLLQAIMGLVGLLPDEYMMETDTLSYPWRINIRKLPDAFCECRLNRNMSSVNINVDSSDQCNRVYAFGAGEGTDRIGLTSLIGSEFLEDAQSVGQWMPISRTFTNDNIFDSITLKDVAERYLKAHKDPKLSIIIDASDIYKATGVEIDYFRLGYACRVPLAAYGDSFIERVIALGYADVYGEPKKVTITLANKIRTATDEIATLIREATQSKLLGGSVNTEEFDASSGEIYPDSPFAQDFDIKGYGNLLAARIAYQCRNLDTGEMIPCKVYVDGNAVDDSISATGSVDILRYLKTDDSGVPLVGTHKLTLEPRSLLSEESWISNKIVLKTIEKR